MTSLAAHAGCLLLSAVPEILSAKVKSLRPGKDMLQVLQSFNQLKGKNGWKLVTSDSSPPTFLEEALSSLPIDKGNPTAFCALTIEGWKPGGMSACSRRWMELLPEPMVPFDAGKRKKLEAKVSGSIGTIIKLRQKRNLEKANPNQADS